jgi:hypothetical protein
MLWSVLSLGDMRAGAPENPAALPVVELPKFEVTDSRLLPPPESWHYAVVPGFEILASISSRETTRFVRDFLLLREAIDVIMPGFADTDVAVPTSLILTGRGKDFDRFVPAERGADSFATNTLFFDDPERDAIVVDFALTQLQFADNTTQEADPYRGFYKEYFRYLIRRRMGGRPPAWLEEGFVQLFASIDVNKKLINFAQVGDGYGGSRPSDFNQILGHHYQPPLGDLFADPPLHRDMYWEAQAYAFVHMCLYGRGQRYQKGFGKFLARISGEAPTEEIFKECFGIGYKEMGLELSGYVEFTDYQALQFIAKKGKSLPEPPPFTLRDATESESGRIVGEVLRLGAHGDEAHLALIAPYVRGERPAPLLAAIGLDERTAGHDDRARKFLEAAAGAKVDRARAYLELARLRFDEARAKPAAAGDMLSEAQVATVLAPLTTARSQRPPMAQVYGLIAEVWRQSAKAPTREEFTVVLEGVQMFPRSPSLVLQATLLAAAHDFPKEALALAKHGVIISRDPADRSRFEMIARAFERDTGAEPNAVPEATKPLESRLIRVP